MFDKLYEQSLESLSSKTIFEKAKELAFEYIDEVNNRIVYPSNDDVKKMEVFYEPLPQVGTDEKSILSTLHENGAANTVAQTGGRYFGFVNGSALPITLAVKWMTDVWDQNAVLYAASPISSVIEDICEKWLVQLFDLPSHTAMGLVGGSSDASLCALTTARNTILERLGWDVYRCGLTGAPPIKVVLSNETHGTIVKALSILGIGTKNMVYVESDSEGTIRIDKLCDFDESTLIILQAGNVNTGAFDKFDDICELAQNKNAWVHIDGAFGLWARVSEAYGYLAKGIDKADSWSVDAHKTLNVPYDCGMVLCKSREALLKSMHASGDYILYSVNRDGMAYTTAMSRRARAFELWAAIKYLGKDGICALVDSLCKKAKYFADQLSNNGFNIINKVVFNQILVSCRDEIETIAVLRLVQEEGTCWCGETVFKGKRLIRISICSWATTEKDIDLSVSSFVKNLNKYRQG